MPRLNCCSDLGIIVQRDGTGMGDAERVDARWQARACASCRRCRAPWMSSKSCVLIGLPSRLSKNCIVVGDQRVQPVDRHEFLGQREGHAVVVRQRLRECPSAHACRAARCRAASPSPSARRTSWRGSPPRSTRWRGSPASIPPCESSRSARRRSAARSDRRARRSRSGIAAFSAWQITLCSRANSVCMMLRPSHQLSLKPVTFDAADVGRQVVVVEPDQGAVAQPLAPSPRRVAVDLRAVPPGRGDVLEHRIAAGRLAGRPGCRRCASPARAGPPGGSARLAAVAAPAARCRGRCRPAGGAGD